MPGRLWRFPAASNITASSWQRPVRRPAVGRAKASAHHHPTARTTGAHRGDRFDAAHLCQPAPLAGGGNEAELRRVFGRRREPKPRNAPPQPLADGAGRCAVPPRSSFCDRAGLRWGRALPTCSFRASRRLRCRRWCRGQAAAAVHITGAGCIRSAARLVAARCPGILDYYRACGFQSNRLSTRAGTSRFRLRPGVCVLWDQCRRNGLVDLYIAAAYGADAAEELAERPASSPGCRRRGYWASPRQGRLVAPLLADLSAAGRAGLRPCRSL